MTQTFLEKTELQYRMQLFKLCNFWNLGDRGNNAHKIKNRETKNLIHPKSQHTNLHRQDSQIQTNQYPQCQKITVQTNKTRKVPQERQTSSRHESKAIINLHVYRCNADGEQRCSGPGEYFRSGS